MARPLGVSFRTLLYIANMPNETTIFYYSACFKQIADHAQQNSHSFIFCVQNIAVMQKIDKNF